MSVSDAEITLPGPSHSQDNALARIFLLAKEDNEWDRIGGSLDRGESHPAFSADDFTKVSAYFQEAVWGTPFLLPSVCSVDLTATSDQVRAYCERSENSPLTVRIEVSQPSSTERKAVTSFLETLQSIASQSHRWHALTILLTRDSQGLNQSILNVLCDRPATSLKYLTVSVESLSALGSQAVTDTGFTEVFTSNFKHPTLIFPNDTLDITSLRLRGLAVPFFWPCISRLTVLHLDHTTSLPLSYEMFKDLVSTPRDLSYLSLFIDTLSDENEWQINSTPQSAIHLPSLLSLRLRAKHGTHFGAILQNVNAPLLRSLVLKDVLDGDLRYDPKYHYPTRFPRLTELTLCNCDISGLDHKTMSQIFPRIQFLGFSLGVIKPTLNSLWASTTPRCQVDSIMPWPEMKVLGLEFNDDRDKLSQMLNFLKARTLGGFPISKIRFATREDESTVRAWLSSSSVKLTEEEYGVGSIETTDSFGKWPFSDKVVDWDCEDTLFL